jgi:CheY-like chemotaxis protein
VKTILVVDDEYSIVETVCEILTWEGYRCVKAADGLAGLAMLAQERPALVLLDYMMPLMDGLQMLQAMKQDPEYSRIPVVLMTAAPMRIAREAQLWDALLRKPFGLQQLMTAVQRFA